ncbi:MAG: EAL domain-containing protein [Desulfarculaceae bacterium]|nr:EAL domain-containing protein [Desulfarculaceae bacterium]MCF8072081.1 EAL domain-containing protein [Desulfarculaceae bacterium]MCF8101598.1 EAL domain-containing protein [Desulfarculaceae bacterium]MCF8115148.1 EAL domain-containing protein [Desulfarculaceae bacterium]
MGPRNKRYVLWQGATLAGTIVLSGVILVAVLKFQQVCRLYIEGITKYRLDDLLLALPLVFLLGASLILLRANRRLHAAEASRHLSEKRFRDIAFSMADWIWETDPEGRYAYSSTAAHNILGYAPREIIGKTPFDFMTPGEAERLRPWFQEKSAAKEPIKDLENWALDKNGKRICLLTNAVPLLGEDGTFLGYRGVDRDITAHKEAEAELHRMAHYDSLTGLPNRMLFEEHLGKALSRGKRDRTVVAVMFMDLDQFKNINDTMGHPSGDLLLKMVADRLINEIRETDVVARFGGDEYAIVQADLPETKGITVLARRILKILSRPFALEGRTIHVSACLGITVQSPDQQRSISELMAQADRALYRAKTKGRNRFLFHDQQMEREVRSQVELLNDLHRALDEKEFRVYYQPQVAIPGGQIIGMEALLRWQHPQRGLLPPKDFIHAAEDNGLIIPMGEWILREACSQLKSWQVQGLAHDLHIAVNLSPVQVSAPEFAPTIRRAIAQSGLSPSCLELELTENLLMESTPEVMEDLQSLQREGIRLSIDDFGTGYSSLQYLKKLPVYKLKIAQEFVLDLPHNLNDAAIVSAVISLGLRLDLAVIAEGVETPEQLDFLLSHGCREVQGYYFSRPMPPREMVPLLRSGRIEPD